MPDKRMTGILIHACARPSSSELYGSRTSIAIFPRRLHCRLAWALTKPNHLFTFVKPRAVVEATSSDFSNSGQGANLAHEYHSVSSPCSQRVKRFTCSRGARHVGLR